jgi:hypothetical protein
MTTLVPLATETHVESAVSAELVGILTLGILLALLIGTLMFGKGRPHA